MISNYAVLLSVKPSVSYHVFHFCSNNADNRDEKKYLALSQYQIFVVTETFPLGPMS